ncbi:MAG: hypothetical protein QOJ29_3228 [Thermoleophilaceae bacterium]|jgi:Ca2+-binding RTX toxin-like protein|nr:hypothetical protein [Thermoleophilaceae bacterium]
MGRGAVLVVALAGLTIAPGAQASTTLGQLFTPTASTTATVGQTGVTSGQSYTLPSDGVITGWAFYADSGGAQVKLKAVRPIEGDQYTVVGESELQTVAASQQQQFATRLPVKAGDLIGTSAASGKSVAYTGAQGDTVVLTPGDQPPGTSGGFSNVQGIRVDVTATVEPDVDGDGYGDETQDLCPTDPSLQTQCTANLTMNASVEKRVTSPGSMIAFGLTVHNSGPSAAAGVQVVAELSPELVLAGTDGGVCTGGQTVTCDLGDVPKDGDAVLRVVATAKTTGPATIAARARSSTADPDQSDNGAGISIAIIPAAGLCPSTAARHLVSSALRGDDIFATLTASECLTGGDNDDRITGSAGPDTISGGGGNDILDGLRGADKISGDAGNDKINGGPGNDKLTGGPGKDQITGGSGIDKVSGGPGDDRIDVADGKRDSIDCGAGKDTVSADRGDRLKGCERVKRKGK